VCKNLWRLNYLKLDKFSSVGIQFLVSFSCVGELRHFGEKHVKKAKHDSRKKMNIHKRYYSKELHAESFYWIWDFCVMLPWNCMNSTHSCRMQHGSCIDRTKQYPFSNKSLKKDKSAHAFIMNIQTESLEISVSSEFNFTRRAVKMIL
jgi:hypothetical protein